MWYLVINFLKIFLHRTSWIHLFHHLAGKLGFQEEGESVDEDNAVEDVEDRLEEGGDAAEHLQASVFNIYKAVQVHCVLNEN